MSGTVSLGIAPLDPEGRPSGGGGGRYTHEVHACLSSKRTTSQCVPRRIRGYGDPQHTASFVEPVGWEDDRLFTDYNADGPVSNAVVGTFTRGWHVLASCMVERDARSCSRFSV